MAVDAARAKSLFLAASDLADVAERAAYLGRECGGDAALRDRVEALLRANDAAPLPPGEAGDGTSAYAPDRRPQTADYGDPTARVGSVLAGKYKLVEEIGAGGMGNVYMAQQTTPVKRAVAVKVIKAGMDSKAVLARFEAERQALAMMDHPNIARVLDAGATESGRPFFVMELVKGTPITQYSDERKLTPRQRLELFVPVCQAIQHAHQKGVIHRDVKPSNVLIALYDDKPVPKVIDFGLAKAAGPVLTNATLMTGFGAVVGTPEYMSPEQANLNNLDVDTRSDVYSLGVLLYELLTGTTPVDRKSLRQAAVLEILRIVREVEAPRPSAKLSTSDNLPSVAANRGTEPAKLSRLMKGELDWVLLKALEKDRTRRYETANALARDIQRYLSDEVVEARPPSATYRLRKLAKKHKAGLATAAAIAALLVAGITVSTWQAVRATNAERAALAAQRAEAERAEGERQAKLDALAAAASEKKAKETAEASEAETEAVLRFVETKVFAAARPEGATWGLGRDVTLRKAIEAALPFVEKSFTKQPLIEARLRRTIGNSFSSLGDDKAAAEQYLAARALYTQHRGPDHRDTLTCMNNLAGSYSAVGRTQEALKLYEETLQLWKAKLGPDHAGTLVGMFNLGRSYRRVGRVADAIQLYEEALPVIRATMPNHGFTFNCMGELASAYAATGRIQEAVMLREETLQLRKAKLGPDHPGTLYSMGELASSYASLHRHTDASRLLEERLTMGKAKHGTDHPATVAAMNGLAWFLATASDVKFRDSARAVELAMKTAESSTERTMELAEYRGTLGVARYRTGDWSKARADLEMAIGMRQADDLRNASNGFFLAMAHWQLGDKTKARKWFDRSVDWMEKGRKDDPELKRFRAEAAELLGAKDKQDETTK